MVALISLFSVEKLDQNRAKGINYMTFSHKTADLWCDIAFTQQF